jgi:hypothetical protein
MQNRLGRDVRRRIFLAAFAATLAAPMLARARSEPALAGETR